MQVAGHELRRANVGVIYLAHGTFAGSDAFGLIGELARAFPAASDAMRQLIKMMIDAMAGDVGNYTGQFAKLFEDAINPEGVERIAVRRFQWSSENHHIGRADGAVRLLDELSSLKLPAGKRVMLWGHSHAGNVFALVTNLLSGDKDAVHKFFEATKYYYTWPVVGCVDIPLWLRVRQLLLDAPSPPLENNPLDVVTFGTPIRYGWDPSGFSRLLHFINHKPTEGLPPYQAPFPPKIENVMEALDGDYVQQIGIAGTNFMPSIFAWRAWWADNRLKRLLQPEQERRDLLEHLRVGARVPAEGTTLLVEYGRLPGNVAEHLAGHAVYTRKEWLLFHAEEIVRRWHVRGKAAVA